MKSINVNISDNLYAKFMEIVNQKNLGIEEGVLEAINGFIYRESEYEHDPFFKLGSSGKSNTKDVSKKHDLYLYGQ